MEFIDRITAKEIVRQALLEVADFTDDFEEFGFELFHPFHSLVFLNYVKNLVNKTDCSDSEGNASDEEYFDIELSKLVFEEWEKLKDCIDYVENSHFRAKSPTRKIQLP
jgi:hypothetical protein